MRGHHHFGRHHGDHFEKMQAMRRGFFGAFDPDNERGPRRGRRRMFDSGELRLVLLKLIEDQPRHGYDLIKEIENLSGGAYAPSPGVVYPTMTLLIDMGLAEEQASEGARKLLAITQDGKAHLAERADEVAEAMGRLTQLANLSEKFDAAPIRRAMQNFKMALRERLAQPNTTREVQLEIAKILDEAVSKIERL